MTRSAVHDTFRIDRHFDAAPARVFQAFADPHAKAKWFGGTDFAVTEQGVYLDGLDNSAQRRQGTEDLMDALAKSLA